MVKDREPRSEEHELLSYSGLQNAQNVNGETVIADKKLYDESPEGRDNPAFEDNVLSQTQATKTCSSFNPVPTENKPSADTAFQTPKQALPGKNELVILVPTHTAPSNRQNNGINSDGVPYPGEIFISVNTHRKFIRGEKLYLTRDLRRTPKLPWRRIFLCGVIWLVISVIVLIASLITTGILLSKSAPPAGFSESYTANRTNVTENLSMLTSATIVDDIVSAHSFGSDASDLFTSSSTIYPSTSIQSKPEEGNGTNAAETAVHEVTSLSAINEEFSTQKPDTKILTPEHIQPVTYSSDSTTLPLTRSTDYGRAIGDWTTFDENSTSSEGTVYVTVANKSEPSSTLHDGRLSSRQDFPVSVVPEESQTRLTELLDTTADIFQGTPSTRQKSSITSEFGEFNVNLSFASLEPDNSPPSSEQFPTTLNTFSDDSEISSPSPEISPTIYRTTDHVTISTSQATPITLLLNTTDMTSGTSSDDNFSIILNVTNENKEYSSDDPLEHEFNNIISTKAETSTSPPDSLSSTSSSSDAVPESSTLLAIVLQTNFSSSSIEISSYPPTALFSPVLNETDIAAGTSSWQPIEYNMTDIIANTEPEVSLSTQNEPFPVTTSNITEAQESMTSTSTEETFNTNITDSYTSSMRDKVSSGIFSATSIESEAPPSPTSDTLEILNTTTLLPEASNDSLLEFLDTSSFAPEVISSEPEEHSTIILNTISFSSENDTTSSLSNDYSEINLNTTRTELEVSASSPPNSTLLEINTNTTVTEESSPSDDYSPEILNTDSFAMETSSSSSNDSYLEILNTVSIGPEASTESNNYAPEILNTDRFTMQTSSISSNDSYVEILNTVSVGPEASSESNNYAPEILNTRSIAMETSSSSSNDSNLEILNTGSVGPEATSEPNNYSPVVLNTESFATEASSNSPNDSFLEILNTVSFTAEASLDSTDYPPTIFNISSFTTNGEFSPSNEFLLDNVNNTSVATEASVEKTDYYPTILNAGSFTTDASYSPPNGSFEILDTLSVPPQTSSKPTDYSSEILNFDSFATEFSSPPNNPSTESLDALNFAPEASSNKSNNSSQKSGNINSFDESSSPTVELSTMTPNTASFTPELSSSVISDSFEALLNETDTDPVRSLNSPNESLPLFLNVANVAPKLASSLPNDSSPENHTAFSIDDSDASVSLNDTSPSHSSEKFNTTGILHDSSTTARSESFPVIPNSESIAAEASASPQTDSSVSFKKPGTVSSPSTAFTEHSKIEDVISTASPAFLSIINFSPPVTKNVSNETVTSSPGKSSLEDVSTTEVMQENTRSTLIYLSGVLNSRTTTTIPLISLPSMPDTRSESVTSLQSPSKILLTLFNYTDIVSEISSTSFSGLTSSLTSSQISHKPIFLKTISGELEESSMPVTSSQPNRAVEEQISGPTTEPPVIRQTTRVVLETLSTRTPDLQQITKETEQQLVEQTTDYVASKTVSTVEVSNNLSSNSVPELNKIVSVMSNMSSNTEALANTNDAVKLNDELMSVTEVMINNASAEPNILETHKIWTTPDSTDVFVPSGKSSDLFITSSENSVDSGVLKEYAENATNALLLLVNTPNNRKHSLFSDGMGQDPTTENNIENIPRESATTINLISTAPPATETSTAKILNAEEAVHASENSLPSVSSQQDDDVDLSQTMFRTIEAPSNIKTEDVTKNALVTESALFVKDFLVTENVHFTSLPSISDTGMHIDHNINQAEQVVSNEQLLELTTSSHLSVPSTSAPGIKQSHVDRATNRSSEVLSDNMNKNESLALTGIVLQSSNTTSEMPTTSFEFSSIANGTHKTTTDGIDIDKIHSTSSAPIQSDSTVLIHKTSTEYSLITAKEAEITLSTPDDFLINGDDYYDGDTLDDEFNKPK